MQEAVERPSVVVGPLGYPLTLANLPSPQTLRWTPRRKAEVVYAINGGLLTVDEACERYSLTLEELTGWQRAAAQFGLTGLRVTKGSGYNRMFEED